MFATLFPATEQEAVMAGCYELTDQRWQMIEDIVSPPQTTGRPRRDDRQIMASSGFCARERNGATCQNVTALGRPFTSAFVGGAMTALLIGS